jgi:hypothetical protein
VLIKPMNPAHSNEMNCCTKYKTPVATGSNRSDLIVFDCVNNHVLTWSQQGLETRSIMKVGGARKGVSTEISITNEHTRA